MGIAELKDAIDRLDPKERAQLEALLHPHHPDEWDDEMEKDFGPGGRLALLVGEVDEDIETGILKDMP